MKKKEEKELALKAYLKLGIHGAYRRLEVHREWTRFNNNNNSNNNYFEDTALNEINNTLTPALEQALKKDFPQQQFSEEELKKKIAEAGARYNEETDEILQKKARILEDNPSIGAIDDRYPKFDLLTKQKQEPSAKYFLDNSSLSKEQVKAIERHHKEEMRQKLKHRSESDFV